MQAFESLFHVVKGPPWPSIGVPPLAGAGLKRVKNDDRRQAKTEPKRGRPPKDAPPRPGSERAAALKGCRYTFVKNPENVTDKQHVPGPKLTCEDAVLDDRSKFDRGGAQGRSIRHGGSTKLQRTRRRNCCGYLP